MTPGERWVLLGLAPARATWFRDVSRWSTAGALPAEFVKCRSVEEVRARLGAGRPWSALLVDGATPGLDRDVVAAAAAAGVPAFIVRPPADPSGRAQGRRPAGLDALGAAAFLPATFGRDELLDVLSLHAEPVGRGDRLPTAIDDPEVGMWRGRLIAVCGPGGTGATTLAAALAQGLGSDVRYGQRVLLADLALRADLAVLHDATDLGPGLQELVDAHRMGSPSPADIVAATFEVPGRPYRLLLGLRRQAAWAALRPRATTAALDGLRRAFALVVADVSGDVEGETDSGAIEVEERNHLARTAVRTADVVLAVGSPGVKGIHSLALQLRALAGTGVAPHRLVPVVNRAPRDPRARAALASALGSLAPGASSLAAPLWVRERKLEDAWRDTRPLPAALVKPLSAAAAAHLERIADMAPPLLAPAAVLPGSIGHWPDGGDDDVPSLG